MRYDQLIRQVIDLADELYQEMESLHIQLNDANKSIKNLQGALSHQIWQSIESAPKNGTAILVYADDAMYVVRWSDPDGYSVDFDDPHGTKSEYAWWHVHDNKHGPYALRGPSPTHWMPLPPEPNTHGNQ